MTNSAEKTIRKATAADLEEEVFEAEEVLEAEDLSGGGDANDDTLPISAELTDDEDTPGFERNEERELRRLGAIFKESVPTDKTPSQVHDLQKSESNELEFEPARGRDSEPKARDPEHRFSQKETMKAPLPKKEEGGFRGPETGKISDSSKPGDLTHQADPSQASGQAPAQVPTKPRLAPAVQGEEPSSLFKGQTILAIIVVLLLAVAGIFIFKPQSEDALEVTVPENFVGDTARYDVWGNIDSRTPDRQIRSMELDILQTAQKHSTMTVNVGDYQTIQDGFGLDQEAYGMATDQALKVKGTVESASLGSIEVEGDIQLDEISYTVGEKVVRNYIYTDMEVFAVSVPGSITSTLEADLFPSLTSQEEKIQMDDVYRGKIMKKGDSGSFEKGGVHFNWSVSKEDEVKGRDCLIVDYEFDKEKLRDSLSSYSYLIDLSDTADVKEAYLKVWITNGRSFEMKRQIYIYAQDGESEFTIDYNAEMVSYSRGDKPIDTTPPTYSPGQVHDLADLENWEKFPTHGNASESSIPADFPLQTAFDEAVNSNPEFSNHIDANPKDYMVYGKYNESNEYGIWNFSFATGESTKCYHVNTTRHQGTFASEDYGEVYLTTIDPTLTVTKDRDQLANEVITFASAEQIFESNDRVRQKAFSKTTGRLDFQEYSLGVRTNLAYTAVDVTTLDFDIETSYYAYFIKSEDQDDDDQDDGFTSGVDARTGQLLFIIDYEYNYNPFG